MTGLAAISQSKMQLLKYHTYAANQRQKMRLINNSKQLHTLITPTL